MFPTIQVGPLNIQAPGLILIISLWVGLNLAEKFAKRRSYPADKLYNLVFHFPYRRNSRSTAVFYPR